MSSLAVILKWIIFVRVHVCMHIHTQTLFLIWKPLPESVVLNLIGHNPPLELKRVTVPLGGVTRKWCPAEGCPGCSLLYMPPLHWNGSNLQSEPHLVCSQSSVMKGFQNLKWTVCMGSSDVPGSGHHFHCHCGLSQSRLQDQIALRYCIVSKQYIQNQWQS